MALSETGALMQTKEIRLGVEYAIKFRLPRAAGMPVVAPVIHATCVDIAGSTVVLEYEDWIPKPGAQKKAGPDQLIGCGNYERGKRRIRVAAGDVICRYDEWQPGGPGGEHDGRIDAPTVTKAAGQTFTAWPMPLPVSA